MSDDFPESPHEQAKTLENILLVACEGKRSEVGL
jgi:hypothetical protein